MQEEQMQMVKDEAGRMHRNQKVFELTKAALTGLLASNAPASVEEIERAAKAAVVAAKFAARELIKQRVI